MKKNANIHTTESFAIQKKWTQHCKSTRVEWNTFFITSNVTQQKGFVDIIKIMDLRWGDYPGLSKWTHSNYMRP